jgi:hypothetical protein
MPAKIISEWKEGFVQSLQVKDGKRVGVISTVNSGDTYFFYADCVKHRFRVKSGDRVRFVPKEKRDKGGKFWYTAVSVQALRDPKLYKTLEEEQAEMTLKELLLNSLNTTFPKSREHLNVIVENHGYDKKHVSRMLCLLTKDKLIKRIRQNDCTTYLRVGLT